MHKENLNLFENLIIIQNAPFRRLNQGWTSLGTIKYHSININACSNSHSSSSRWILFPKWTKIMKLELKRTINCCTKICTKVLQIYLCKLNLNVAFECCYITSFQVTSCDFFFISSSWLLNRMIQLSMKLVYIQLLVLLSFITPFKFFYVPSVAVLEYFYSTAREKYRGLPY